MHYIPAVWAETGSRCWQLPGTAQTGWRVRRWWCCTLRSWCSCSVDTTGRDSAQQGSSMRENKIKTVKYKSVSKCTGCACVTYSILKLLIVLSVVGSDSPFLLCDETKTHVTESWHQWKTFSQVTISTKLKPVIVWATRIVDYAKKVMFMINHTYVMKNVWMSMDPTRTKRLPVIYHIPVITFSSMRWKLYFISDDGRTTVWWEKSCGCYIKRKLNSALYGWKQD